MDELDDITTDIDTGTLDISNDEAFADIEEDNAGESTRDVSDTDAAEQAQDATTEQEPNKEEPPKQQKEINKFAEARRQREAKQKALIERVKQESIEEGQISMVIGLENPYTGKKIEDEYDAKEYLLQIQCYKAGKDPITDFYDFKKQKEMEAIASQKATKDKVSFVENDREAFFEKYPDVNLEELGADPVFQKVANNKLGKVPLVELYEEAQAINKLIDERVDVKFATTLKKQQSTPGALGSTNSVDKVDYSSMSDADFDKVLEKAKRGELRQT